MIRPVRRLLGVRRQAKGARQSGATGPPRQAAAAGAAGAEQAAEQEDAAPSGQWGAKALRLGVLVAAAAGVAGRRLDISRWWGDLAAAETAPPSLEELPTPRDMEWRVLSRNPRVFAMDDFLSAAECAFLVGRTAGRLEDAVGGEQHLRLTAEEERGSPMLQHIAKRTHRAARIPEGEASALQISRRAAGQGYELAPDVGGDLLATVVLYLSGAEEGGEAFLPLAAGRAGDDGCGGREGGVAGGLLVPARRGRALLLFHRGADGQRDPAAGLTGCPLRTSELWVAQRSFRTGPQQHRPHRPDWRFDGLPALFPPVLAEDAEPGRMDVRVVSRVPLAYVIEDFLSPAEVRHLARTASKGELFAPRGGASGQGQASMWLEDREAAADPVLSRVVKRMHRAALLPDEALAQGLRLAYTAPGGSSEPRLDTDGLVTLSVYLDGDGTAVTEGATIFPRGACSGLAACCTELAAMQGAYGGGEHGALLVPPVAGRALLLFPRRPGGRADASSRHGVCPAGPEGRLTLERSLRVGAPAAPGGGPYAADALFDGLGALGP